MAIMLPVFLLLVFGITEYGINLYRQETLANASREGARQGIIQAAARLTTGQIQTVVTNYLGSAGWNTSLITFPGGLGGAPARTDCVGVVAFPTVMRVSVAYPADFNILGSLVGGTPATLRADTVMTCE
jgi:Flp pilus assembly protein TadG